jgi:hypothetical protein
MELLNSIKKTMVGEAKPCQVAMEKKVEATKEGNQWQTKSSSGMYT